MRSLFLVSSSCAIAALLAGCVAEVEARVVVEHGADEDEAAFLFDAEDPRLDARGEGPIIEAPAPFVRLGMRLTSPTPEALELRTSVDGQTWDAWRAPELVFSEDGVHAGHVDVIGAPARFLQHRVTDQAAPAFLALVPIEVVSTPTPTDEQVSAGDGNTAEQGLNVAIQSRASWGARAPRCRSTTSVERATIHHTAGANDDNTPVATQLRQIQAFHMDSRGWCDIGYNFLVSRDGRIWEGRGYATLGAHTENANSGNMGICFLGTYTSVAPPLAQQIAAAKALRYLHDRAGIPLTREGVDGVKGHRQRGTTSTTCPGDALYGRLADIVARAKNGEFAQSPCQTGDFDGAFCDDDSHGSESFHNKLKNTLDVDFHCADKNGNPAYCPTADATRKDAIFVLGKAAGMPTGGHPDAFPDDDGKREAWFNAAKAYAIILGIDGRAEPDRKLTRSSLAVIVSRMYALPAATRDYFDDDDGHARESFHNRVAEAGLIVGYADANGGRRDFRPGTLASRSTLAVVAWRAHEADLRGVWTLPEGCRTGDFDGAFCNDDGRGAEASHDLLAERGVSLPCADVLGEPAFCGAVDATRGDAIYALTQAFSIPRAGAPDGFDDDDQHPREAWFDAAKVHGVVTGYAGGTEVRPEAIMSRDNVALVLVRMFDLPTSDVDAFTDDDGDAGEARHNQVAAAGLLLGSDDGAGGRAFRGADPISYDGLATIVMRAVNRGLVPIW